MSLLLAQSCRLPRCNDCAEFERSMIRQRVKAGLAPIKAKIARGEKFTSKAGIVRRNLGRPGAESEKVKRAREELARGTGIGKTARLTGLGTGAVHRLKREMALGGSAVAVAVGTSITSSSLP
jgi:DNA invertase Pin-like site-specific DNA recombinase